MVFIRVNDFVVLFTNVELKEEGKYFRLHVVHCRPQVLYFPDSFDKIMF